MTRGPVRCLTAALVLLLAGTLAASSAPVPPDRWAYTVPKRPPRPTVKNRSWVRRPIDTYVLAALERAGLHPSPPASREVLIRRATYDVTGLPPTPAEVATFVGDKSPEAWAKVVDRLLASPRFGEHWGRGWLQIAGYRDVSEAGEPYPEAWRYRDWVVRAFNQDLPYDRFVTDQLAGDIRPWDADRTIATGFLAIGTRRPHDRLWGTLEAQTNLLGKAFLGLPVSRAMKADDPRSGITQGDYQGLFEFFGRTSVLRNHPDDKDGKLLLFPLLPPDEAARRQARRDREAVVTQRVKELGELLRARYARERQADTARYLEALWEYSRRPASDVQLSIADFAAPRGLNPFALQRWAAFTDISEYPLLTKSGAGVGGNPAVYSWRGENDNPSLTINTTGEALQIATFLLPPKSVSVHPSPNSGVAVRWRCPVPGTFRVTGEVRDADGACGNGVAWSLARATGGTEIALAQGEIDNTGRTPLSAQPLAVTCAPGESLLLAIQPRGEYSCDTTAISLRIQSTAPNGGTWDLASDLVPMPLAGNPHADSSGRPDVWRFLDLKSRSNTAAPPGPLGAALASWSVAIGGTAEAVREAAAKVQAQFDLVDARSPFWIGSGPEERFFTGPDAPTYAQLAAELAEMRRNPVPPTEYAYGARDGTMAIEGAIGQGPPPPRFPAVLAGPNQPRDPELKGRRELAAWLTRPDHPLTARVAANRIWEQLLGRGIVHPTDDFSAPSTVLTRPLLDWLAVAFATPAPDAPQNPQALGGSTKALIRLLMLSATYRQSSDAIGGKRNLERQTLLFGRQSARKLDGPAVRDALVVAAGLLTPEVGGPAVPDASAPRRTLYLVTDPRPDRPDFLAKPEASALTRTVATRLLREGQPDTRARVVLAYRLLYGRSPATPEVARGLTAVAEDIRQEGGNAAAGWARFVLRLARAPEMSRVD